MHAERTFERVLKFRVIPGGSREDGGELHGDVVNRGNCRSTDQDGEGERGCGEEDHQCQRPE